MPAIAGGSVNFVPAVAGGSVNFVPAMAVPPITGAACQASWNINPLSLIYLLSNLLDIYKNGK